MSIIQPVIWMVLIGKTLNMSALISSSMRGFDPSAVLQRTLGTSDYFSFMAMGMIAFTTVMTSVFIGMTMVLDRRLGFLSKVVTAPVYRPVIMLSKVLSITLRCMFQAGIITIVALLLGLELGTNFTPLSIIGLFGIVFLMGAGMSSLFAMLTLRSTRMETFQAIMQLLALPLLFASNCFFPIDLMPSWLQVIARVNPVSYMIDATRQLMVFSNGYGQLAFDFACVGIFAMIMTAMSIILSRRLLEK
jgi:ABC-2 type transport system permease protein